VRDFVNNEITLSRFIWSQQLIDTFQKRVAKVMKHE